VIREGVMGNFVKMALFHAPFSIHFLLSTFPFPVILPKPHFTLASFSVPKCNVYVLKAGIFNCSHGVLVGLSLETWNPRDEPLEVKSRYRQVIHQKASTNNQSIMKFCLSKGKLRTSWKLLRKISTKICN